MINTSLGHNVGLAAVPPPVDNDWDLNNFQGLPRMEGVNNLAKGYNEYVLYGEVENYEALKLTGGNAAHYYYFYVGMSWDNGEGGVLQDEGAGRGLFFKNSYTDITEGWYCTRNDISYFNWQCLSSKISEFNRAPEIDEMPNDR